MKNIFQKFKNMVGIIIFLTSILFTGCQKDFNDKPTSEVRFKINALKVEKPSTKKALMLFEIDPAEVDHIRIGIDGSYENPMISQTLPFSITDGVTDPIKLSTGDHYLTSLVLLKETSPDVFEVMYSAVSNGAPLSEFVSTTLPIFFHIPLLGNVPVSVDVVALDSWTPEDFGWATFSIGITTINVVYFYGANDEGNPSVMEFNVYDGTELISTSSQTPEGYTKVLYPDKYSIPNVSETYIFNLTKDGLPYSRTFTVDELLALPKEVHLLNVYGSGMMNFELATVQRTFTINYRSERNTNGELGKVELKTLSGTLLYSSGTYSVGPYNIPYTDNLQINDASEGYLIRLTRVMNNDEFIERVTTVAHMRSTPIAELYWLDSGAVVTGW